MRTMIEIGKDLLNLFYEINHANPNDIEKEKAVNCFVEIMNDFFQYVINDMEEKS